jgi:hypothetical protein
MLQFPEVLLTSVNVNLVVTRIRVFELGMRIAPDSYQLSVPSEFMALCCVAVVGVGVNLTVLPVG